MTQIDVERWKEEVIQEGCVGLSWTDPSLMKSPRGTDKGWYRADNACCTTDEHTHTHSKGSSKECSKKVQ